MWSQELQGNSSTFDIFSELEEARQSLKKTQIHFKTDVFAAVAVVHVITPYCYLTETECGKNLFNVNLTNGNNHAT